MGLRLAEVERLRGERGSIEAELAQRQRAIEPSRMVVKGLAAELRDFGRHLREMYEAAAIAERKALLRTWLEAPEGENGPVVVDFAPSTEGKRRHGVLTGGVLWIRPMVGQFRASNGGGSPLRNM